MVTGIHEETIWRRYLLLQPAVWGPCGETPNPILRDALLLVNLGRANVMCHPFERRPMPPAATTPTSAQFSTAARPRCAPLLARRQHCPRVWRPRGMCGLARTGGRGGGVVRLWRGSEGATCTPRAAGNSHHITVAVTAAVRGTPLRNRRFVKPLCVISPYTFTTVSCMAQGTVS
ncbi:hypothetical protein E2C01_072753 [Portunus trituberculatus]|uniref:Uncharacterized protein n=1 Tax=Portunus trituberculatus TaxID=210409 RepID=A0A5B7IBI4_PORTR|nr:hypothetical protein [Portunus trituberculatus]